MEDSHLTLRLPAPLARLLTRWAAAQGVPKSRVVREAVTRYLQGTGAATPSEPPSLAARDLARRWVALPRLLAEEADGFAGDITASREALPSPITPWE